MFTIAILEDNELFQRAILRRINSFMKKMKVEYCILQYSHPEKFQAALSKGIQFDLLWTDNELPGGKCGIEILRELREDKWKMPIILCSASGPEIVPEATVRLEKPASPQEIKSALEMCTREIKNETRNSHS